MYNYQLCEYIKSPSIVIFGSGMSNVITDSVDSFQRPLNMLEKYPDCERKRERERERERGGGGGGGDITEPDG